MCITAIGWQLFDEMPLLILSNRDEFIDRPTLPLYEWQGVHQGVIAGQDAQAGGTWLGVHPQSGRWGILLNYRKIDRHNPRPTFTTTRGEIVVDFLLGSLSPLAFARQLEVMAYDGFNLVIGDRHQAVMLNNRGHGIEVLANGLYVLSNGEPNDAWFKTERLRGRVRQEVLPLVAEQIADMKMTDEEQATQLPTQLSNQLLNSQADWQTAAFAVLTDTVQAPVEQLPPTGLSPDAEMALSSIFIPTARLQGVFSHGYGTGISSVVAMTKQHVSIVEKQHFTNRKRQILCEFTH